MSDIKISEAFATKYFYFQLYRPEVKLHLEVPSLELGVYQDGVFVSLLEEAVEINDAEVRYVEVPNIKAVIFLDALYRACKGMEPFLTISTRLYKNIVDDHQSKAVEIDLDAELFTKIKTIYWGILQENATDELIEQGFEIVVKEAIQFSAEWMVQRVLGE